MVPAGPAAVDGRLGVGDVIVMVNTTNVLGYTHAALVALFQSTPVGTSVMLTVSHAYRLRPGDGEEGGSAWTSSDETPAQVRDRDDDVTA